VWQVEGIARLPKKKAGKLISNEFREVSMHELDPSDPKYLKQLRTVRQVEATIDESGDPLYVLMAEESEFEF
jgi:hypothetical protein